MGEKLQWVNLKSFPWLIFFIAIAVWIAIAGANFYYQHQGGYTGTGILFPISVIYPNQFLWSGFVFAFLFLISGIFAFRFADKMNVYLLFDCCYFGFIRQSESG
jgi:hypothetical protein